MSVNSSRPPCHFFIQGKCRNGDKCAFSHESQSSGQQQQSFASQPITTHNNNTPPPSQMQPIITNTPQGQPIYSIDVECVASGISHNARSVAQVAMVDEWQRPIFNAYIKQELPVFSYISELTGLTKEILETSGQPLGIYIYTILTVSIFIIINIISYYYSSSRHLGRTSCTYSTECYFGRPKHSQGYSVVAIGRRCRLCISH